MSPYSSVLSTERAIADNCVPGLEPGVRPVNVGKNALKTDSGGLFLLCFGVDVHTSPLWADLNFPLCCSKLGTSNKS